MVKVNPWDWRKCHASTARLDARTALVCPGATDNIMMNIEVCELTIMSRTTQDGSRWVSCGGATLSSRD